MNKAIYKAARRALLDNNRRYESWIFTDIPRTEWPESVTQCERQPIRVVRCREFLAQIFQETENIVRISVSRTDLLPNGTWRDGITWDELQRIKNAAGYAGQDAVEAYPAENDVVNVANIRHLWVLPPEMVTFLWRKTP